MDAMSALFPAVSGLAVFAARFIYPFVDAPRTLGGRSCARDEKWLAAGESAAPQSQEPSSLTGTTWEGTIAVQFGPEPVETTTFEFLPEQQIAYQDRGRERPTDGHWRQNGAAVLIEINDGYAKYEGTIAGSEIKGEYSNEIGGERRGRRTGNSPPAERRPSLDAITSRPDVPPPRRRPR